MSDADLAWFERQYDVDEATEARVRAIRASKPADRVRIVRQTVAMIRELRAEAVLRREIFSNLHDDAYSRCGQECCNGVETGRCMESDRLAAEDRLLGAMADIFQLWDNVIDECDTALGLGPKSQPLAGPDDPFWDQLEARLVPPRGLVR